MPLDTLAIFEMCHGEDYDDMKMIRDYFSYEHFYVIYCLELSRIRINQLADFLENLRHAFPRGTFWELDSDHDFLLDKDDLLKYDGTRWPVQDTSPSYQ